MIPLTILMLIKFVQNVHVRMEVRDVKHANAIGELSVQKGKKKRGQLAFTPHKALRLTFHDC